MLSFHKEFKGKIALWGLFRPKKRWRSQSYHDKSMSSFSLHRRRNYQGIIARPALLA
jgi:hypothetical protein